MFHNTVQEAVTKTIPKKNKFKKTKWLSQPQRGLGCSSGEGDALASEKEKRAWDSARRELGRVGDVQGREENRQRAGCTLFTVEIILHNALQA